jgi:uncharacterized radical SAM protein YgiQ
MQYDVIFVLGEPFFDHPLSGPAILKRLLEKKGYSVGIIENPSKADDIKKLGKPNLFFAVSSGSIDSMLRNYTPLKKLRKDDKYNDLDAREIDSSYVPDRAIIVYCNWIRQYCKDVPIVIGGVEATLRRFTHYDYWDNAIRKPILLDSRADILCFGNAEKSILEVADKLKEHTQNKTNNAIENSSGSSKHSKHLNDEKMVVIRNLLQGIRGTCIVAKNIPANISAYEDKKEEFTLLPSHEEVLESKEKFCDLQNGFTNISNLAQKCGDRYILQYRAANYSQFDLDEYYSLPFTREIPASMRHLRGFQFSVVSHRGCIGECSFCSLALTQGNKIISRSEESILKEIESITKHPMFKGNIDDLGGPSADMYGMDCAKCNKSCIGCPLLKTDKKRIINLLRRSREIAGVKKINIRSGIRYDLCSEEYLKEVITNHVANTLRIAPEHVSRDILKLMNKTNGNLERFISLFNKISKEANSSKELSFYFMTAHPGSTLEHAKELAKFIRNFKNTENVQIFTPTPMTISTCMYYTGMDPKTKQKVYVPYTYSEKKEQKRVMGMIPFEREGKN